MAIILIGIDLRGGLTTEIILHKISKLFIQPMGYYGVSFHCIRCHKYGHLVVDCDLPLKKKSMG
jgi:hypothetical protein